MALVAFVTGEPFVFPSLGPTAFLLFYTPLLPASSPRNTIGGHAIGAAAGYLALVVFGLTDDLPALATSVTGAGSVPPRSPSGSPAAPWCGPGRPTRRRVRRR